MAQQQRLGYSPNKTLLHQVNATTKLVYLLVVSIACMTTYDTRLLLFVAISSLLLFKIADIHWHQVSFVIKFIIFFSVLNLVIVYLFEPEFGVRLYGTRHVIWEGVGRYNLTLEQLFYEFNLCLKYFCSVPLAIIFLLTTNPSEFASSLNHIGVSYKIGYAVSLALRYIPDIQEDYFNISQAQQARGVEMSKKSKLSQRIKGSVAIVMPLIFSSLDRIEVVSTAMELRRFGKLKKRTWYVTKPLRPMDYCIMSAAILIFVVSLVLFRVNGGRFYNPFV